MSATIIFTAETAGDGTVTVAASAHGATVSWDDGITGWAESHPSAEIALMRAAVLMSLRDGGSFTQGTDEFAASAAAFLAAQGESL